MLANQRHKTLFERIFPWFFGILLFVVIGTPIFMVVSHYLGFGQGFEYSEGTRSGIVYKLSKKGTIYKTWEGELSLGLNERDGDGNIIPAIFNFSVTNPEIVKQLQDAERAGKRVTLHYKEYILRGVSYGSTAYDIVKVE